MDYLKSTLKRKARTRKSRSSQEVNRHPYARRSSETGTHNNDTDDSILYANTLSLISLNHTMPLTGLDITNTKSTCGEPAVYSSCKALSELDNTSLNSQPAVKDNDDFIPLSKLGLDSVCESCNLATNKSSENMDTISNSDDQGLLKDSGCGGSVIDTSNRKSAPSLLRQSQPLYAENSNAASTFGQKRARAASMVNLTESCSPNKRQSIPPHRHLSDTVVSQSIDELTVITLTDSERRAYKSLSQSILSQQARNQSDSRVQLQTVKSDSRLSRHYPEVDIASLSRRSSVRLPVIVEQDHTEPVCKLSEKEQIYDTDSADVTCHSSFTNETLNDMDTTGLLSCDSKADKRKPTTSESFIKRIKRRAGKTKLLLSMRQTRSKRQSDIVEAASNHTTEEDNSRTMSDSMTLSKDVLPHILIEDSPTSISRKDFPSKLLKSPDHPRAQLDDRRHACLFDMYPITPPTPFRSSSDSRVDLSPWEVCSDETDLGISKCISPTDSLKKTITYDLKKEIEQSLLHWPSGSQTKKSVSQSHHSTQSLHAARRSRTIPNYARLNTSNGSLGDERANRPLSWSCDMTSILEQQHQLQVSVKYARSLTPTSRSRESDLNMSDSHMTASAGSTQTINTACSNSSFEMDEFGDSVAVLEKFDNQKLSLSTPFCRRMSQPFPIKAREAKSRRLSITKSGYNHTCSPQTKRILRSRSKSEPGRLNDIIVTHSNSKAIAKLCLGVGDLASLDIRSQRHSHAAAVRLADPLWHHITDSPEELCFRVGDVIKVLDMTDKDWWWGQLSSNEEKSIPVSGWFPSTFVRLRANQTVTADELLEDVKQGTLDTDNVVQHYSSELLSRDQARINVINEIISAEKDYVKHLRDIVEGFQRKASERGDMFTDRQVDMIFSNVADIYCMAQLFQEDLEETVASADRIQNALIGHCFLKHKNEFEIYSEYCNNHPRSLEELQKLNVDSRYMHFFEACRLLQNMIELPLDGFLLTPVQKICKYPLQLAELLKYTHPEHKDYPALQEALGAMKEMAMLINERKRKMESLQKIAEWQATIVDWEGDDITCGSSELIHSGELCRSTQGSKSSDRLFFLFDHQLVGCKKESSILKKSLVYKERLCLDEHTVVPVEEESRGKQSIELRNADGETVMILSSKSAVDLEKWVKAFVKERDIVQQDKESGFSVTDSFKELKKLSSPTKANTKQSKTGSLRRGSDNSKENINSTTNNNNIKDKLQSKKSSGLIGKFKRSSKVIA